MLAEKNILVTGGAGYIGSHVCKALKLEGYRPITYDNLSNGYAAFVRWGPLEIGDILDTNLLDGVFRKYKPHAVLHFAALSSVAESIENPDLYYRNNIEGTLSLLRVMNSHNINKIIFSSTASVYGHPGWYPITEDFPLFPINPYGRTKLCVEYAIQDYISNNNGQWISLRYFNAAGADPECDVGEAHEPETHLIPLVIESILGEDKEINIFGVDYTTIDGTCVRDYVHVSDLANAHVLALRYLENSGVSGVFNLGNSVGFSVREVISATHRVTQREPNIKVCPRRPGDPPILIASSERARKILNWKPVFYSIDQIIETAWRWRFLRDTVLHD